MLMTPEVLTKACKDNSGYRQPHLNDQIFLQCRGFCEIKNLEPYINLKVLWLEQNAISEIVNIGHLSQLTSLFLQNNTIRSISGLEGLVNLRVINLSHNYISKVTGLKACQLLETVQLSHNRIESFEDMEELWSLPNLGCLDISYNKLDERTNDLSDADIVNFFAKMPELSVLYFHGQEIPRRFKNYRKTMIVHLKKLTYLDEKPIFPQERRTVEAWGVGGVEAERAELERIKQEKVEELTSCLRYNDSLRIKNAEVKAQREKEYAEAQEAEKKRLAAIRVEYSRLRTELDHLEYEVRAGVATVEDDAFTALTKLTADSIREARAKQAIREREEAELREQRRRDEEAEAAIEARTRELEAELAAERAKRQAQIDDMTFWVKKMAQDDAAVEAAMQSDLDALLAQLQPPSNIAPRVLPSDTGCSEPSYSAAPDTRSEASTANHHHGSSRKVSAAGKRWLSAEARYEAFYAAERSQPLRRR